MYASLLDLIMTDTQRKEIRRLHRYGLRCLTIAAGSGVLLIGLLAHVVMR